MRVVITIVVIVLFAAGVYGFVRTARFGVKAADIYDRYEAAVSRSHDST
jgi:hypothetical protein